MKSLLLILSLLITTSKAFASFEATSLRYLSGAEVIDKVYRLLPSTIEKLSDGAAGPCEVNGRLILAAGENNPNTGRSIYLMPSTTFYSWYSDCVDKTLNVELRDLSEPTIRARHLGPLANSSYNDRSSVSEADVLTLVTYQTNRILGPDEVILDYGYIKDCDQFKKSLAAEAIKKQSLSAILKFIELELMSRDEFLSY